MPSPRPAPPLEKGASSVFYERWSKTRSLRGVSDPNSLLPLHLTRAPEEPLHRSPDFFLFSEKLAFLFRKLCQVRARSCQVFRKRCQVRAKLCQVSPKPCQVRTKLCQVRTKLCQVSRKPCQVRTKLCQISRKHCQVREKPCQVFRKHCQVRSKLCQVFPKLCQVCPKRRSFPGILNANQGPVRKFVFPGLVMLFSDSFFLLSMLRRKKTALRTGSQTGWPPLSSRAAAGSIWR